MDAGDARYKTTVHGSYRQRLPRAAMNHAARPSTGQPASTISLHSPYRPLASLPASGLTPGLPSGQPPRTDGRVSPTPYASPEKNDTARDSAQYLL